MLWLVLAGGCGACWQVAPGAWSRSRGRSPRCTRSDAGDGCPLFASSLISVERLAGVAGGRQDLDRTFRLSGALNDFARVRASFAQRPVLCVGGRVRLFRCHALIVADTSDSAGERHVSSRSRRTVGLMKMMTGCVGTATRGCSLRKTNDATVLHEPTCRDRSVDRRAHAPRKVVRRPHPSEGARGRKH